VFKADVRPVDLALAFAVEIISTGARSIESGSSHSGGSDAMLDQGESHPKTATIAAMQYGIIRSQ